MVQQKIHRGYYIISAVCSFTVGHGNLTVVTAWNSWTQSLLREYPMVPTVSSSDFILYTHHIRLHKLYQKVGIIKEPTKINPPQESLTRVPLSITLLPCPHFPLSWISLLSLFPPFLSTRIGLSPELTSPAFC